MAISQFKLFYGNVPVLKKPEFYYFSQWLYTKLTTYSIIKKIIGLQEIGNCLYVFFPASIEVANNDTENSCPLTNPLTKPQPLY